MTWRPSAVAFMLAVLLAGTSMSSAQNSSTTPANLEWKNVLPQYHSLAEIKPLLVNKGTTSVFLSRLYPLSAAQLQRFNHATDQWGSGNWSITCGLVAKATVPIEVKPRRERAIQVYWQLSTDDWDNPRHFVLRSLEERPLDGRYRFLLRYSLQPWTLGHHPNATFVLLSPEFTVAKD